MRGKYTRVIEGNVSNMDSIWLSNCAIVNEFTVFYDSDTSLG